MARSNSPDTKSLFLKAGQQTVRRLCEHAGILGQGNIILESLGSSIRYRWGGSPVHVSSVTGDINTKTAADVNSRASHDRSRGLYCLTNTHHVSSAGWDHIHMSAWIWTLPPDKTFIYVIYLCHIIMVGLVDNKNFDYGLDFKGNIHSIYLFLYLYLHIY